MEPTNDEWSEVAPDDVLLECIGIFTRLEDRTDTEASAIRPRRIVMSFKLLYRRKTFVCDNGRASVVKSVCWPMRVNSRDRRAVSNPTGGATYHTHGSLALGRDLSSLAWPERNTGEGTEEVASYTVSVSTRRRHLYSY
jgi:hypothetical protein